jgi:alpha-L-rhamnosidase
MLSLITRKIATYIIVVGLSLLPAAAQTIHPDLLSKEWKARWITHPDGPQREFGVFYFRKTFENPTHHPGFIIHVSADNRYRLFVNGTPVLEGPARGDLLHWRFESLDITKFVRPGKNVIAAVVWNYAGEAPMAQMTSETGFLLQANDQMDQYLNSSSSWKCLKGEALTLLPPGPEQVDGYYVAGPGEQWDGARYPWGWESVDYDDSAWKSARELVPGDPRGIWNGVSRWFLVPRNIPAMEQRTERLARVVRGSGVEVPALFLEGRAPLTVPARTRSTILFDHSRLTTAYPEVVLSGGRGASLTLTYAEALVDAGGRKGNRNETEGKTIRGYQDRFLAEGGRRRLYRPLWWRTFRYLQAEIETGEEPLVIEDLRAIFSAYPFTRRARFASDDPELDRIWEAGWHTLRLSAHEHYTDSPYYEQLQYIGDTRMSALITLYTSGDDRLVRNALELFDASRVPEGLTQSRYPSLLPQFIAPYSLLWVGMTHDFWVYRGEADYLRRFLPGIRGVLEWYEARLSASGLLGPVEWWNFVDWVPEWNTGTPPLDPDGQSTILSLQYAGALREAAEMEDAFGSAERAAHFRQVRGRITEAVRRLYRASERRLVPDTAGHPRFSQHASLLAVLEDAVPPEDQKRVMEQVLNDKTLSQATFYFRYYLHRAMKKAGLGDEYVRQLQPWRDMLALGLTTWAENPEPARSDCHAWSAHPSFDLLATVAGIEPAAPGFQKVRIEPHLGPLTSVDASLPHPRGDIVVSYRRNAGGWNAHVKLPSGLTGTFVWQGQEIPIPDGGLNLGGGVASVVGGD